MLRKAETTSRWVAIHCVPGKSRDQIAAAFGTDNLRYNADTKTLKLPSRMRDVTWEQYGTLLKALPDHRLRHTYDRGFFEIMSPSQKHGKLKTVIGGLIEQMALAVRAPFEPFGSATCRRKSADRGLEPDETYYIANATAMRGKFDYDPRRDPPPDLAVEVDLRRPTKRRMRIYAALRIPEVWKYDGQAMRFFALGAKGKYEEVERSLSFPFVTPADFDRFLARLATERSDEVLRAIAKWAKAKHRQATPHKQRKKKSP